MSNVQTENQKNTFGIYVYSLPKSASVFLYYLFKDLSQEKNISYFSIHNKPQGADKLFKHDELTTAIQESFCFCPQRNFLIRDEKKFKHIHQLKHIFQTRDPRDILVSQYFSEGWIHGTRSWNQERLKERDYIQEMSIDDYCISRAREKGLIIGSSRIDPSMSLSLIERYKPAVELQRNRQANTTFVRYEDMVNNFQDWLSKVIIPFGLPDETEILNKYYHKYKNEFIAESESMTHKRKITPGDYLEKLQPSTIKLLNEIFYEVLKAFNYSF